jgi:hypothetical protein
LGWPGVIDAPFLTTALRLSGATDGATAVVALDEMLCASDCRSLSDINPN